MRACRVQRHSGLFTLTSSVKGRFVPPWERDGKSADEFFAGLMQSGNPIQKRRRDEQRARAAHEEQLRDDPVTPEDQRRLDELLAHNEKVLAAQRNFLPYGSTPRKYFETTCMAAWGEYQSRLCTDVVPPASPKSSTPSTSGGNVYSPTTQALLMNDMHDSIPYRYTTYVPPGAKGALRWPLHGTAGVVLDIDGVIYRSGRIIPGSDAAVRVLQELRVPLVFMTNGGSKSEGEKAAELSALLGCAIAPSQVLLAHSPMRLLTHLYRHEPVLIVGPPSCAAVARAYGFEKAISILQFQAEHPELVPFKQWGDLARAEPNSVRFPPLAAVLQFSDPRDGFNDAQVILDVLTAPRGQVGSYVSGVQSVPYYISGDDLLWASAAHLPRLGQGAFREMFAAVYESVTGQGLQTTMYGKPRAIAYAYAEQRLKEVARAQGWDASQLRAIFMVGDNLETDIIGANAAGGLWTSVHVLSGVGSAPAARRTLSEGDEEHEWLETCVSKTPHYIAPTLDHFVRELLAFPQDAVLQNKRPYYGKRNPVDLKEMYLFSSK